MALAEGTPFGPYMILGPLGEGGMATVYRAFQPSLRRTVAIKVIGAQLAAQPAFRARFRREAEVLARLEHPNILPVHDFGEVDGQAYIVYRYVSGGTLAQLLPGPLPLATVVRLLAPVADALDFAHSQGIVHRDIKPGNILLTEPDARGQRTPIVADFGLARLLEPGVSGDATTFVGPLTQTGVGLGTPAYMAPEQVQGLPVDGQTDQYALGIVAYQLLTGTVPFRADTPYAVALKHVTESLPPARSHNPVISETTEQALYTALAKNSLDRFPSCNAFIQTLERDSQSVRGDTAVSRQSISRLDTRDRSSDLYRRRPTLSGGRPSSQSETNGTTVSVEPISEPLPLAESLPIEYQGAEPLQETIPDGLPSTIPEPSSLPAGVYHRPKSRAVNIAGVVLGLLLAGTAGVVAILRSQGSASAYGAVVPSQGNAHVNPGDFHIAYNTDPPTSGPHFPTVPQPQIYKDPLATEFLPHFLEHAGVEILYNQTAPADVVAKLKEVYRQEVDKTNVGVGAHLLLAPRPDMPCEVTVTAWQRITAWASGCSQPGAVGHDFSLNGSPDIDRLKTFIERNYCQYDPENTCGNGAKGGPINNNPVAPKPGEATVQATLGTATTPTK